MKPTAKRLCSTEVYLNNNNIGTYASYRCVQAHVFFGYRHLQLATTPSAQQKRSLKTGGLS